MESDCSNNKMASLLKSTSRRFNFVHQFIFSASILCFLFGLSAAASSSYYTNQHLSFHDGFQPDFLSNFWNGTTLSPGSSHRILESKEGEFLKAGSKKRQVRGGANEIKQRMSLKLIHRSSPHSPHPKNHSAQVHLLKDLLELDAVRLKGYRFSSRVNNGRLASNSMRRAGKAADARITHARHHSDSANDRISSGATLGSGQYFVDFYVGTPARKYSLIVDTGSDLIWVQCHPCRRCYPQSNAIYYPRNSSSFLSVPCTANQCFLVPAPRDAPCDLRSPTSCRYTYMYSDTTSTTGILASETVTMMSSSGKCLKISNITFGCGIRNGGPSLLGSNGVLGLGQGAVSFASQVGYRFESRFSYCLVDYLKPITESSLLVFGDANIKRSLKDAIQYTPLLKNIFAETYYYVGIKHVCVNGHVLPIHSKEWQIDAAGYGGTIVDSGTTLTYFRQAAYSRILAAFQRAITFPRVASIQGLDLCFNFSAASGKQMPEFSFLLEGDVVFQPPPENYFVDTAPDVKCLAMHGVASPLASNTIGNLLQQNFFVEYDRLKAQLGFVRANCSSSSL
ncbi:hypothetical protein O6H91_Y019000 [Diphasiastrum complanatum]|nr:hypothetical protein O6H91_Y019000 [Diphasiastrum complanatum]KAJ7298054.1 hypothetical protein O6H91_Y019000 [Diphasiastrum complanatum]